MSNLYIQTAFLGDLLLAIPSLRQIRYWQPQSSLTLVCRKGYGRLIEQLALCDRVIEVDSKGKKELGQQLKSEDFDTVFCPHQSFSSHQLVKQLKAKTKVGYSKSWNRSYFDKRVKRNLQWPEAIRQLQLVGAVDESVALKLEAFAEKPDTIPQWAQMLLPSLAWKESELQKKADQKVRGFKVHEPYVCILPGSVWPTKRWLPEYFVKAATALVRENFQILILGAPDERDLCEKIQGNIPNSYSMAGQLSIWESIQFLSKAQGLICNDSGAMHMASLLHKPTLAVFGPTVTELGYKPWNPNAQVIENEKLLCRPCGQHGGKFCPIGTHRCMKDVPWRKVVDQAMQAFSVH